MPTKEKSPEAELSSCPHCKCRIKPAKLKVHLREVHLIKGLVVLERINTEPKKLEE